MGKEFNNILVIGNGFDLALNYDTRYSDFINFIKIICLNQEIHYNLDDKHTKDLIDRVNKEKNNICSNHDYSELLKITQNNCFIKHFAQSSYDISIWADVEEEIYKIIKSINSVFSDDNLSNTNSSIIIRAFHHRIDYIELDSFTTRVLIEFNIISQEHQFSKDNKAIHGINTKYYDYVYKIKWKTLTQYLFEQLDEFKRALIIYLRTFVPMIRSMYIDSKIEDQLKNIENDKIITFNYTDFYKDIYETKAVHIHGQLDKNNIVLGFGEDSSLSLNYIRFFKYFQRIQNKLRLIKKDDDILTAYSESSSDYGIFIPKLKKKNIVHFYGVSFDKTDEDYIKEIYGDSKDGSKIYVYYYDDKDFDRKIINLISIFDKDTITNDIHNERLVMVPIEKEIN